MMMLQGAKKVPQHFPIVDYYTKIRHANLKEFYSFFSFFNFFLSLYSVGKLSTLPWVFHLQEPHVSNGSESNDTWSISGSSSWLGGLLFHAIFAQCCTTVDWSTEWRIKQIPKIDKNLERKKVQTICSECFFLSFFLPSSFISFFFWAMRHYCCSFPVIEGFRG